MTAPPATGPAPEEFIPPPPAPEPAPEPEKPETDAPEKAEEVVEAKLEELPERLRDAAVRAGWTELMPVQARAIPCLLAGRDAMVQSRTGSGKTGAFVLPMLDRVDPAEATCQALVLTPTRELALQVATETKRLCGEEGGPRVVPVYGGVGYAEQMEGLNLGAHIVVGTPGRILDHLLRGSLSLGKLKMLVFDEADRMLSMGFFPDMKRMQTYLPEHHVHSSMFSATFPPTVMTLAHQFLENPETLSLSRDHVHVTETQHLFYCVPAMEKDRALIRIIEIENPVSSIVFCNTRQQTHYVATVLQRFGYDAAEISSDLNQNDREKIMARARKGELRFLVATDVAARGIDIPALSHVFLYEPPEDPEAYIHRAGRTGRAGATGVAISLVNTFEEMDLLRISREYSVEMEERPLPTEEDVERVVSERVTTLLEADLRQRDRLETERSQRFLRLGRSLAASEDELAVIAMLLDDYYQKSLHAAPTLPEPTLPTSQPAETGKPRKRKRRSGRRRKR